MGAVLVFPQCGADSWSLTSCYLVDVVVVVVVVAAEWMSFESILLRNSPNRHEYLLTCRRVFSRRSSFRIIPGTNCSVLIRSSSLIFPELLPVVGVAHMIWNVTSLLLLHACLWTYCFMHDVDVFVS